MEIKGQCKELFKYIGRSPDINERIEIVSTNEWDWDAWVMIYNSISNKLIRKYFVEKLRYYVYSHILRCSLCRKTYKPQLSTIAQILNQMEIYYKPVCFFCGEAAIYKAKDYRWDMSIILWLCKHHKEKWVYKTFTNEEWQQLDNVYDEMEREKADQE